MTISTMLLPAYPAPVLSTSCRSVSSSFPCRSASRFCPLTKLERIFVVGLGIDHCLKPRGHFFWKQPYKYRSSCCRAVSPVSSGCAATGPPGASY